MNVNLFEFQRFSSYVLFKLMLIEHVFIFFIHFTVNSPGNVQLWEEKARKEALEHAHGH